MAKQGLFPPIGPSSSRSRLHDESLLDLEHIRTASAVRGILVRYHEFQPTIEASGLNFVAGEDRTWISRSPKRERFQTQPFYVAEPCTGILGKSVSCADTIRGCQAIFSGVFDELPEHAFYRIGAVEESSTERSQDAS